MSRGFGPCMCGATDCPSCGPAQGYEVKRVWTRNGWRWVNPDPDDESDDEGMAALESDGFDLRDDGPDDYAADRAADRWQADIDARHA